MSTRAPGVETPAVERLARLVPWLGAVLTLGLALPTLGTRDLWLDEAFTIGAANQMPQSITERGGSMALYYVLMGAWSEVSSDPAVLRLPSAVLAGGAVWVIGVLTHRVFGARAAVISTLLLVPTWGVLRYAQEARSYSLVMLLAAVSWLLFFEVRDDAASRRWVAWGLVSALLVYSHPYGALVLVAQGLALASTAGSMRASLQAARTGVITLGIALLPMAVMLLMSEDPVPGWIPPLGTFALSTSLEMVVGPIGWAQAVIALCLVLASVGVAISSPSDDERAVLIWLWVPGGILLLVSLAQSAIVGRFLIGSLPAVAILFGLAITRLDRASFQVIASAALLAVIIPGHLALQRSAGPPWTEVVGLIEQETDDGHSHGIIFPDQWQRTVFRVNAEGRPVLSRLAPVYPSEPWTVVLREYEAFEPEAIRARAATFDVIWTVHQDPTPWRAHDRDAEIDTVFESLGWCRDHAVEFTDHVLLARFEPC